jgi:hypothetical protein
LCIFDEVEGGNVLIGGSLTIDFFVGENILFGVRKFYVSDKSFKVGEDIFNENIIFNFTKNS